MVMMMFDAEVYGMRKCCGRSTYEQGFCMWLRSGYAMIVRYVDGEDGEAVLIPRLVQKGAASVQLGELVFGTSTLGSLRGFLQYSKSS